MATNRQQGFTLLELIVVLFIIVLGFSAIALKLGAGSDTAKIRAAAREMVSALRYARGQALMNREQTAVIVDLSDNSYSISDKNTVYRIPEAIAITMVTAQTEYSNDGTANVRFYPDGSSTGGHITLELGQVVWRININWLTGQVELESE